MYRRRHRHNLDSVTIGRYAGEESNTENTVSVGRKAGYSQQKQWAIAIGDRAGEETQDLNAIAIGVLAGQSSQSTFAIAIGNQAGRTTQGTKAIAIGGNAGQNTQSTMAMAIGENAGQSTQGEKAIAIGGNAGQSSQGAGAIAIGENAGQSTQSTLAMAIGENAGQTSQGTKAIAIGGNAGEETQGLNAIAIGDQAGNSTQGIKSIAIGDQAGNSAQGARAIAIGDLAGKNDQPESSIIISTSDTEIMAKKKGLYIDPIRKFDDREARPATVKEGNVLSYNYQNDTENATKEVVTGFPRLPVYPTDAEVLLAFTEAKKGLPPPVLGPLDNGTMYFDSTKKKVKVYNGTKWVALADEDDLAKLKAAVAAAAMAGQSGTVAGSGSGSAQATTGAAFVTGGGASATTPQYVVDPVTGETRLAVSGVDFYWEDVRPEGGEQYYAPVFYNTLTVVGNTTEHTNNNPNLGGNYITTYSNGHQVLTPIPISDYNPALDQYNNLDLGGRRALLAEYGAQVGVDFFISPSTAADPWTDKASYDSQQFQDFLKSKGLG